MSNRNLIQYISVSCEIAPHWASKEETGTIVYRGWGKSPQQAKRNAKCVSGHNVNGVPVLGDYAYIKNGKKIIVDSYSDNLINADGSVRA